MGDSYKLRITSPTGNDWFQWIVLVTEFYNELEAEFGLQNHKELIARNSEIVDIHLFGSWYHRKHLDKWLRYIAVSSPPR